MSRIVLLTHEFPPYIGGIGKYAEEIATAASESGNEVTVYAPLYHLTVNEHNNYPFTLQRFSGGNFRPRNITTLLYRTWNLLSEIQADVIHAVDIPFTIALAFLKNFKTFSYITSVHGAANLSVKKSTMVNVLRIQDLYKRAERIFANSSFTKNLLLEHYRNISEQQITVAHLGVNKTLFNAVDKDLVHAMRTRYGIKPENHIILTVARFDRRKGQHAVFEAIEKLQPELQQQLTYVVVGDGNDTAYKQELHTLANKSHAQIIFTGSLTGIELQSVYAAATVFCMPGDSTPPGAEGFGLVYLEAAASGTPSIAYNIASAPEVIHDNETGLLVPQNDIDSLARAIRYILQNPDQRHRLSSNARTWASSFTWKRCAEITYGSV